MEVEGNIRFFQAASDPGAALRMGKKSAQLSRFAQAKRSAPSGISLQTTEAAAAQRPLNLPNQDLSSQFAADRHAAELTTPQAAQAMAPTLASNIDNLRQGGDQEDNIAADDLEDDMDDIAQSQEQAGEGSPAGSMKEKLMSQIKGMGGNAKEELQKKAAKELAKQLKALYQQALKDLGLGEPGYLATLINSSATVLTVIPGVASLFYKDISEPVKAGFEGLGMPLTDYNTPIGIVIFFQFVIVFLFWTVVAFIILPLALITPALPVILAAAGLGAAFNWLLSWF